MRQRALPARAQPHRGASHALPQPAGARQRLADALQQIARIHLHPAAPLVSARSDAASPTPSPRDDPAAPAHAARALPSPTTSSRRIASAFRRTSSSRTRPPPSRPAPCSPSSNNDFQPFDVQAIGLDLWHYLGGPWQHAGYMALHASRLSSVCRAARTRLAHNIRQPHAAIRIAHQMPGCARQHRMQLGDALHVPYSILRQALRPALHQRERRLRQRPEQLLATPQVRAPQAPRHRKPSASAPHRRQKTPAAAACPRALGPDTSGPQTCTPAEVIRCPAAPETQNPAVTQTPH